MERHRAFRSFHPIKHQRERGSAIKSIFANNAVLLTTTFSLSVGESRAKLALKTCAAAAERGFRIITVDGSPCKEFKAALRDEGAVVIDQRESGMEASRREVFQSGLSLFPEFDCYVWLEPEKHTLVPLLDGCIEEVISGEADLVIPRRRTFRNYPHYQQWSELLANWYLGDITGRHDLDYYSGPRIGSKEAFRKFASYNSGGDGKWRIIFIPIIQMMWERSVIKSVTVDYIHPVEQSEEDDYVMRQKRDEQRVSLVSGMELEARRIGMLAA